MDITKVWKAVAGAVVTGAVGGPTGGQTIIAMMPPETVATIPWWGFFLIYGGATAFSALAGYAGVYVAAPNKPSAPPG